ncbi:MAG: DUF2029 domain-containing protein [Chloroflexota bacterium]|nr:DUF2029 domain-containing protein [Chloroflexota bacterium]
MLSAGRWRDPLAVGIAIAGLVFLVAALYISRTNVAWGYDYAAYHAAAQRILETGTPYQPETLAGPFRPGPLGLYLYSPPPAVFFTPLTGLPRETATLVWLALRLAILGLTCALMPVSWPVRLFMFGIAGLSWPVVRDSVLGNISLVVTFFAVLGWRFLDRPAGGAAVAAAVALRPTMALVLGWWLIRGHWRPLVGFLAAGVAMLLLTLPFVGLSGWLDYVAVLRNVSFEGVVRNLSLGGFATSLGWPPWAAGVAQAAGYAAAINAVLLSLRRDRELSYVVTVVATLLLSPLLWDHYLTHLLVPAAFLVARGQWWGAGVPMLCWLPETTFPLVALVALVAPFLAPDRGERAGTFLDRLPTQPSAAPT